jgi:hypothetical protein
MPNYKKIVDGIVKIVIKEDKKVTEAMENSAAVQKKMAVVDKADTAKVTRQVRKKINELEASGSYKKTAATPKKTFVKVEPPVRKKLTQATPARKTVSDKDASEVAKEISKRPSGASRARLVKKPSLKSLTPSEKRYETLGKKAPVSVTKKKPMSLAEIKKAKAVARKAKFDKVLAKRPKPAPNRKPLKPIDTSRGSNRPVKPRLSDKDQILENAKNNPRNWDIADQRPKATIDKGRGDTQQPPSITKNPIKRNREERIEARKARRANVRDKRTDIREASTPGFEKLQSVRRGVPRNAAERAEGRANAEARARLAAKAKKGSKMSKRSTTNDPRNAASDAGNMRERLKAIDKLTAERAKNRSNKVSAKLKAKVNATLGSSKNAKKSRSLQNTFNPPKFSRNVTTGKLRATRPIKPAGRTRSGQKAKGK